MTYAHISFAVSKNCWNLLDSCGEICVYCGCCDKDKRTRYAARIRTIEAWLKEKQAFDRWYDNPEIRALQEYNVAHDIKQFKRMLRYYRARLAVLETEADHE